MPEVAVMIEGQNGPTAAEYADEWNGIFLTPAEFEESNGRLDRLLEREGRRPEEVRRSLMTRVVFGRDEDELDRLGALADAVA